MSNVNTYIGNSAITTINYGTSPVNWVYGGRNPVWLRNDEDCQTYSCIYKSEPGIELRVLNNIEGVISMEVDNVPIPVSTGITPTTTLTNLKIVVNNNKIKYTFRNVPFLWIVDCHTNYIGDFYFADGLQTITFHSTNTRVENHLPTSVEEIYGMRNVVYLDNQVFQGTKIKEFIWNPLSPAFIGSQGGICLDCTSLTAVTLGNNVKGSRLYNGFLPGDSFYVNRYDKTSVLKTITLGKGITSIGGHAFGKVEAETIETITLNNTIWPELANATRASFCGLAYNGVINVPSGITGTPWTEYPNEEFANKNWTINYI